MKFVTLLIFNIGFFPQAFGAACGGNFDQLFQQNLGDKVRQMAPNQELANRCLSARIETKADSCGLMVPFIYFNDTSSQCLSLRERAKSQSMAKSKKTKETNPFERWQARNQTSN